MAWKMENIMKTIHWLRIWSAAVGAMDTLTGVMLMFFPALTLGMIGVVPPPHESLVLVSWIGVFVTGVGLSYGMALGNPARGVTVWAITGLVRALVAVFLTIKILSGALPHAWLTVALTDGVVAAVQLTVLRLGWWKGDGT